MLKINKLTVFILLLIISFSSVQIFAQNTNVKSGLWQMIVDGKPGEGSILYRFDFKNDSSVVITKQGGNQNLSETKNYQIVNNKILITGDKSNKINEFNGEVLNIKDTKNISFENNGYVGILKQHNVSFSLLHWILALLILILLNELFRRNKWFVVAFFIVLPILLTAFVWINQGVTYWFKWAKVYSVVFAVIWFTAIRFTKLGKYNWVKLIAAMILALNIAEAVSQDFSMGYLPNILNAIAGTLNIITLFYGWKQIAPDNSKQKDMIWPEMTTFWIIAYDIWNIVYVYLNFPGSTSIQFVVLTSATVPALLFKKGTWLQARAFTLAAWFMYYFTFPRFTEQTELLVPRNETLMLTVASISFIANFIYLFIFLKKINLFKHTKEH